MIKSASMATINAIPALDLIPTRRVVKIRFRDHFLELPVRSAGEHLDLQVQSTVKTVATDADLLQALPVEPFLGKAVEQMGAVRIDDDVLWAARQARRHFQDIISMEESLDGEAVLVFRLAVRMRRALRSH